MWSKPACYRQQGKLAACPTPTSGYAPVLLWCCPARAGSGAALFRPSVKEVAMRTLIAVVALVVVMAVLATLPAAAVQQAGEKVVVMAERIQDLNLTDA